MMPTQVVPVAAVVQSGWFSLVPTVWATTSGVLVGECQMPLHSPRARSQYCVAHACGSVASPW